MTNIDRAGMFVTQTIRRQVNDNTTDRIRGQVWDSVTEPILDDIEFTLRPQTISQLETDLR